MKGYTVVVEHDFYSRKPIEVTFKCSLVKENSGDVLHSTIFKERVFDYGLHRAEQYKRKFLQPEFISTILAIHISDSMGFKINTSEGMEQFFSDMFENASTEFLHEYLKRTKSAADIEMINQELTKRGVVS